MKRVITVLVTIAVCSPVLPGCAARSSSANLPASSTLRDTHERLNGVLWMQTSAEFHVLSTVAYRDATERLTARLADVRAGRPVRSAAIEQEGEGPRGLPLAVIVDVDETILDNSPMSGQLIADRKGFDSASWSAWVERAQAAFLPGAREFVELARQEGVDVFFVTNRTKAEEDATIRDLLPLVVSEQQVLTSGETGAGESSPWPSEKKSRREFVAKTHWIIAMVGDDLADFIPGIRSMSPADRVTEARKHADRFGRDWFLLPNPLYGSWESVLFTRGVSDTEELSEKRAHVKGF